jgi:hypothetical protein
MNFFISLFFLIHLTVISLKHELSLPLCGTDISLILMGSEWSPVLLYNMHDDENTAAVAGRIMAMKSGGQYMELSHGGERNITFLFDEDTIRIDPNRIYTDEGIQLQMAKNKSTDSLLFAEIAMWRDSLLNLLQVDTRSLVIALHNNTNKNYSLLSYACGGEYEMEADTTYEGKIRDMDDFFFVTDERIFNALSTGRYHVVLQANQTMTDDGSLSVYCAQHGIRYVNVEAQHTHLLRQLKMLIFAFQRLVINEW